MSDKFDRFTRSIPKVFKPNNNPVMKALLEAFSSTDEEIVQQIQNTKAQLFIRTAESQNLDILASSLGVSRPVSLGLTNEEFQELIPNLSLKAKQVRKAFYETSRIFWGELFTNTNIETQNSAPYNISTGDELQIKIDDGEIQKIKIISGEVNTAGAATAEELADILSRIEGATTSVITDSITGNETVNIRTDTPGPRGAIEILQSSMVGASKVNFTVGKTELRQQDQRVMIYEIRPNEVVVEIPATVPALRRTLKGSHHFHADSTIESPVAPANEIWQGSFLFDPSGSTATYTVSGQNAILEEEVSSGSVRTKITVDDTSKFEDMNGVLIFGWGTEREEIPVKFRGVPNSKTILIDPSYVFQNTHPIGTYVNVLVNQKPYKPLRDGTDLAVYMVSPSDARETVQDILRTLAAAGVIVNYIVLAPSYRYIIDNPYLSEDDAPEI